MLCGVDTWWHVSEWPPPLILLKEKLSDCLLQVIFHLNFSLNSLCFYLLFSCPCQLYDWDMTSIWSLSEGVTECKQQRWMVRLSVLNRESGRSCGWPEHVRRLTVGSEVPDWAEWLRSSRVAYETVDTWSANVYNMSNLIREPIPKTLWYFLSLLLCLFFPLPFYDVT